MESFVKLGSDLNFRSIYCQPNTWRLMQDHIFYDSPNPYCKATGKEMKVDTPGAPRSFSLAIIIPENPKVFFAVFNGMPHKKLV